MSGFHEPALNDDLGKKKILFDHLSTQGLLEFLIIEENENAPPEFFQLNVLT